MPRSNLKLHLNATNEKSAKKIVNHCINTIDRPPVQSSIEKYHKGGYMADLEFFHNDNVTWSDTVIEIIALCQKLGRGISLLGSIEEELNTIISNQCGGSFTVSGVQWLSWDINRVL